MKTKMIMLLALSVNSFLWGINEGFDFGDGCGAGNGTFEQEIRYYNGDYENAITVGEIPQNIEGLHVELISNKDVDIRLYAQDGTKLVHWPHGLLHQARRRSVSYENTTIVYSGYNGVNGQKGHEYIDVTGAVPSTFTMKAFGYKAGHAVVNYSWTGKRDCAISPSGTGHFTQEITHNDISLVGTIPPNINNLEVNLTSAKDLDIQLYGEDGTAIIAWPNGLVKGARIQHITYNGMNIEWSGYDGVNNQKGHEYIKITNTTTERLTMKVYGYEAGYAEVNYRWGDGTVIPSPSPSPSPQPAGNYMLTAWNDLGMHCMDGNDFSVFSVLPPYNNLHAQLKDKNGNLITSGVTITYESTMGTDGKINTNSAQKTNFWDFAPALFGTQPIPNIGLTGNPVSSLNPASMTFNTTHQWWEAEAIPMTPYNDDGSKNYYPLVKVVAKNSAGQLLAEAKTVLPVSDEMDCRRCHASNTVAEAKPSTGWVNNSNPEKDYKLNILRLHDDEEPNAVSSHLAALQSKGFNYNTQGLEATALSGTPVLCVACHKSNALPGVGIGIKAFTNAIHSKHANVLDPQTGLQLGDSQNRSACYACHPGAQTKCLRGAMGDAKDSTGNNVMQCQSCHGTMHAVADKNREGWLDEPNCQACHHDGVRDTSAIDPATNTLKHVIDTRFATNIDTPAAGFSLFRFSTGHGDLQCEACHGATHAIYPAHNADNILSEGIQGHAGTISECTSCHTTVPSTTTGGPHGMHPVGQSWVKKHEDVAEHNAAQCKACHGQNYQGSGLSKMWKTRNVSVEGQNITLTKGHQVSCYDCHNGPSGDGSGTLTGNNNNNNNNEDDD